MKARAPKISARFFVSSRGGCGRLASAANASLLEGGMTGKPAKREAISPDNPRTIRGQSPDNRPLKKTSAAHGSNAKRDCAFYALPLLSSFAHRTDRQILSASRPGLPGGHTRGGIARSRIRHVCKLVRKKTPREISTGGKRAMRIRKLSRNFASAKPRKRRRTAHSSRTQRQTRKVKYASKERFKSAPAKMSAPDFQTKKAPQNKESLRTKPRIKKRRTNVPAKKILLFFGLRFRRLRHSLRFAAGL